MYVPSPRKTRFRGVVWFAARTEGDPLALGPAVREEFMAIDREQPVEQVGSLELMLTGQFAQPRFQTELMSSFALMALMLASVGIYGVNAYAVTQRRNEIGLRMALGATQSAVLREVIGQGMRLIAIGIAIGLVGAEAIALWLRSVLVGDRPAGSAGVRWAPRCCWRSWRRSRATSRPARRRESTRPSRCARNKARCLRLKLQ